MGPMRRLAKSIADALYFLHEVACDEARLATFDDVTRSYFQAGLSIFSRPDFAGRTYAVVERADVLNASASGGSRRAAE